MARDILPSQFAGSYPEARSLPDTAVRRKTKQASAAKIPVSLKNMKGLSAAVANSPFNPSLQSFSYGLTVTRSLMTS
jgi:hypothetical protein